MPLSPQVQKRRDAGGDQQPGHAIFAFVSVDELIRFLREFASRRIGSPWYITMGMKILVCREVINDPSGQRLIYRSGNLQPPFEGCHVSGGAERPVRPDMRSYGEIFVPHPGYGMPGPPHPYSMWNGWAHPGADVYNHWPPIFATCPIVPTARPPTWGKLPLNGSPPLSNGITADSIMRPRGGPGIFGLGLTCVVWRGLGLRGGTKDSKNVAASYWAGQCVEYEATIRLNLRDVMSCSRVVGPCRS